MATTSPDNIVYPAGSDKLNPLKTWLAQLASSVQAAITSLREDAVLPPLPDPITVKGADTQEIASTSWDDMPNMDSTVLNLDRPCWVSIDIGGWVRASVGFTDVSARVTGATTLSETQVEVGGDNSSWGQVMHAAPSETRQQSSHRTVRLNAGANTITVRARRNGAGTNTVRFTTLQVSPLRWA